MMGAKNLVPAKYPRSLENCLCYPQKTMRVVATRVLRVCGSKSGSFSINGEVRCVFLSMLGVRGITDNGWT